MSQAGVFRRARPVMVTSLALAGALLIAGTAGAAETNVSEAPRVLQPDQALAETLKSPRYRFCHDPKYPLSPAETQWCSRLPLAPEARAARCPTLRVACQAGATATPEPKRKPIELNLPRFGGLGQGLFWLLIGAGVVMVIVALLRQATTQAAAESRPPDSARRPDGPAAAAVDAEVERDVERLLARAHAAATAGDFAVAIRDLYAALLRRLEGAGQVHIHPSATNGDYLRELRGKSPNLAAQIRPIASDVEATEFGAVPPSATLYQGLVDRIAPLVYRTGAFLALLLPLGAVALGCGPPPRPDWAGSPSGTAAVAEFLSKAGRVTHARLPPLTTLRDGQHGAANQIVLLPEAELGEPEWSALHEWLAQDDKLLVVATGPRPLPSWIPPIEMIARGQPGPLVPTAELGDDDEPGDLTNLRGSVLGGAWLRQGLPPAGDILIERDKKPYAVMMDADVGRVLVLADDGLFSNAALTVEDNAALLLSLLKQEEGPIELVGEETGLVATTPVTAVAHGRLAPFAAQLGACLILFLLMQGRAFGKLIDRDVTRRRVFAEHVRALGTQYARARASHQALTSYGTWVIERLRERLTTGGSQGVGDLAAAVAARTGQPMGDVARVLFAARKDDSVVDKLGSRSAASIAADLGTMRDLTDLLSRTGTGRHRRGAPPPAPALSSSPSSLSSSSSTTTTSSATTITTAPRGSNQP